MSSSKRPSATRSASSSWATSTAAAAKTSVGAAPWATSVATRRSAACSSASRAISARASALAIAVPSSSVNSATRASVSGGIGRGSRAATTNKPHRRPWTTIGTPTADRIRCLLLRRASSPEDVA